MNLLMVQRILGLMLLMFSLTMLPPVVVSLAYGDGHAQPFLTSFVIIASVGALLWLPVHRVRRDLRLRDGFLVVASFWIVPKHYVTRVGDAGFRKHPIGLGPYKFVSYTPGVELVLEAVESYWRKVPSVKRLVFKTVPDATTRPLLRTTRAGSALRNE